MSCESHRELNKGDLSLEYGDKCEPFTLSVALPLVTIAHNFILL